MAEEWILTVDNKSGKIEKLEVKGAVGRSCLQETEALEKQLGTVTNRTMKAESRQQTVQEKVKLGK